MRVRDPTNGSVLDVGNSPSTGDVTNTCVSFPIARSDFHFTGFDALYEGKRIVNFSPELVCCSISGKVAS